MLCGLEMMPAFIALVMGIGSLVIAGLVALVTALVVRRRANNAMTAAGPDARPRLNTGSAGTFLSELDATAPNQQHITACK